MGEVFSGATGTTGDFVESPRFGMLLMARVVLQVTAEAVIDSSALAAGEGSDVRQAHPDAHL